MSDSSRDLSVAVSDGGDGGDGGDSSGEKVVNVKFFLRDINPSMVSAWEDEDSFGNNTFKGLIEISCGDIFTGAPAADAIVSPANSFGFMDGGIDMAFSRHFGWQMQERLQKLLCSEHDGELPVGCAAIILAYPPSQDLSKLHLTTNEATPIHYLISAPTMRIPTDVSKTVNAYLAFRAILRAVKHHNLTCPSDLIRTVLCPGLGTAVGHMPVLKCALQMRTAYEVVMFKTVPAINHPSQLSEACSHHVSLYKAGQDSSILFSSQPKNLYFPSIH